jgi:multisubunit Na+/H+ antiporter MnhG subunit
MVIVLSPLEGSLLTAFIAIGYGLTVEKYHASYYSVMFNIFLTVVLSLTVNLSYFLEALIFLYVVIGLLVVKSVYRFAFAAFDTKTFGALSLTIAIGQYYVLDWLSFLIAWIFITVLLHVIGMVLRNIRE